MALQDSIEALADPNRRQILELLKKKELTVGEIAESFEISGASLSHHLNKLKSAGLIVARRQGQNIFYSIHTSVLDDVAKSLADLLQIGGGTRVKRLSKKHA